MGATHFSGPVAPTAGHVCSPNPAISPFDPVANTVATQFRTYNSVTLTDGTDTAFSTTLHFITRVFVPHNCTLTGIGYLIGSVGGTDKVIVELKDSAGVSLANSSTSGVTVGTAATMQSVPFTATIDVAGPAYYLLVVSANGATAKLRTIPAATMEASTTIAGSVTSTALTVAAVTPPTTFTADKGPIAFTY